MPARFVPWGNLFIHANIEIVFSNLYARRKSNVEKNVLVINSVQHTNNELLSVA